jgi:hypothetical protein
MRKLQEPFKADEIEWRIGATNGKPKANPPVPATKGIALAYVTNRAIQNRLDEVFGIFGWKNEFREWKKEGQLCGISVLVDGEWITKWDGADDSNMEATKGGLSDSMKRAAYQWGIGRYLYKLENIWVDIKDGKFEDPKLPKWALPEDTPPEPLKITKSQRLQLYKAANENVDFLKSILNTCGYNDTSEVNSCDFDNVMTAIKLKQAS